MDKLKQYADCPQPTRWGRIVMSSAVSFLSLSSVALAQPNCANRDRVVEKLAAGYGETFAGGGLQNSTHVFEVWFSEEKGTWTILMTRADGTTCIMASGTNWHESLNKRLPGKLEIPRQPRPPDVTIDLQGADRRQDGAEHLRSVAPIEPKLQPETIVVDISRERPT